MFPFPASCFLRHTPVVSKTCKQHTWCDCSDRDGRLLPENTSEAFLPFALSFISAFLTLLARWRLIREENHDAQYNGLRNSYCQCRYLDLRSLDLRKSTNFSVT